MVVLSMSGWRGKKMAAHTFQMELYGGHFFPCHPPYIESTTILSDKSLMLINNT